MARSQSPTPDTLKRALKIAEEIQRLENELASILAGTPLPAAVRRRGRPSKEEVGDAAPARKSSARKKRTMSEEGRQRIIEAQKKRWASARKG